MNEPHKIPINFCDLQTIEFNRSADNWVQGFFKIDQIKRHYTVAGREMLDGAGVKVAIIDNGINQSDQFDHKDIRKFDIVGTNAKKALEEIAHVPFQRKKEILESYDEIFDVNTEPAQGSIHGSDMAALIGGRDGLAPACELLILNIYEVIQIKEYMSLAIYFAISQGANIINISQDVSSGCMPDLYNAVAHAYAEKVFIVCGSGNTFTQDQLTIEYPAAYQKTFAIGAFDRHLDHYDKGDTGRLLDLMAPGVGVPSLINGYDISGTSSACAIVSGLLAIFLQKYKAENNDFIPTYHQLKKVLSAAALHPNKGKLDERWGYGVIHPLRLFAIFEKVKIKTNVTDDQMDEFPFHEILKGKKTRTTEIDLLTYLKLIHHD